jgi:hypothetical protein
MAMIGPVSSRAPRSAASNGRAALAQMALDVLDHDDGVVHHQPDGQHDGEQREQVQREAERLHQEDAADQGHRDGDDRHQRRADRTEEQEDHEDHDQQRVDRVSVTSWMALLMYSEAS